MLVHISLTAEAEALKKQILAIPRPNQPLDSDTPPELSPEQMEDLYYACGEGANWAIPELKKLIASARRCCERVRHPGSLTCKHPPNPGVGFRLGQSEHFFHCGSPLGKISAMDDSVF